MSLDRVRFPKNLIIASGGFFLPKRWRAEVELVPAAQRFRCISFQRRGTSYEYLASNWVVGLTVQTVDVIKQDARNRIKDRFHLEMDVEVEVYEVW